MVNVSLVQLVLCLLLLGPVHAALSVHPDRVYAEGYLGEKRLDGYFDRFHPVVSHDIYRGKLSFKDTLFWSNFFDHYIFDDSGRIESFLKSELPGAQTCSNSLLSEHFDEIVYGYRLITFSYLVEAQWHLKLYADHFGLTDATDFDLQKQIATCRPKSQDMRTFIQRLKKYRPKNFEVLPKNYSRETWWKELQTKGPMLYSQFKMGKADLPKMAQRFRQASDENNALLTLLCSEEDEVLGLSTHRLAYVLVGTSNIINTWNQNNQAQGCLRRFSEIMGPKEVRYKALSDLFPSIEAALRESYKERYIQGRIFFYGSGKEFDEKGLEEAYVHDQPFKVAAIKALSPDPVVVVKKDASIPEKSKALVAKAEPKIEAKKEIVEIKHPVKSAFLQASELRKSGDLAYAEVDMLKLKYDYVFSLAQINDLRSRLKTFMTRDALLEMLQYDKLGSKEAPVPLLFIKFLMDMNEHQALWNIVTVLGDKFWVSNEIDSSFSPGPEFVQFTNNDSTGRQWQLLILRP